MLVDDVFVIILAKNNKTKEPFPFLLFTHIWQLWPVPFNLIMLRPMTFMVLVTFINVITIHYHIIIIITPRQHQQHQEHLYLAMHQYQLKIFRCERAMATISFCHPCISCLQSWFLLLIFHSIISLIYIFPHLMEAYFLSLVLSLPFSKDEEFLL